jgi:hypothetical protein
MGSLFGAVIMGNEGDRDVALCSMDFSIKLRTWHGIFNACWLVFMSLTNSLDGVLKGGASNLMRNQSDWCNHSRTKGGILFQSVLF